METVNTLVEATIKSQNALVCVVPTIVGGALLNDIEKALRESEANREGKIRVMFAFPNTDNRSKFIEDMREKGIPQINEKLMDNYPLVLIIKEDFQSFDPRADSWRCFAFNEVKSINFELRGMLRILESAANNSNSLFHKLDFAVTERHKENQGKSKGGLILLRPNGPIEPSAGRDRLGRPSIWESRWKLRSIIIDILELHHLPKETRSVSLKLCNEVIQRAKAGDPDFHCRDTTIQKALWEGKHLTQ